GHRLQYMGHLPDRLRAHAIAAQLFRRPGTAVVAVSGGADSVALLDLLVGAAPELGLTLVVAHAGHGIQAGSRAVGQAVKALAEHAAARGLPFHDDPANGDPRHLRSWLRTTLLPALVERLGGRVRDDLLRLGRAAASERRAWDAVLELVPDLALHVDAHAFDV